jgi:hypothetical protein
MRWTTSLEKLYTLKGHPQATVCNMVAEALGKIGEKCDENGNTCIGDEGIRVLGDMIGHNYYRTRIHTVEAITKVRAVTLLPKLKTALMQEPIRDVQIALKKTIDALHDLKQKMNVIGMDDKGQ